MAQNLIKQVLVRTMANKKGDCMSILILCADGDEPDSPVANPCAGQEKWEVQPAWGLREKLVKAFGPRIGTIEFCDNVPQLTARFHRPMAAPAALILVIDGQDTLESLISVRDFFDGIPVIVIPTFESPQTLRQTYALCPRYIGHDDDLIHVAAVLANLTTRDWSMQTG